MIDKSNTSPEYGQLLLDAEEQSEARRRHQKKRQTARKDAMDMTSLTGLMSRNLSKTVRLFVLEKPRRAI